MPTSMRSSSRILAAAALLAALAGCGNKGSLVLPSKVPPEELPAPPTPAETMPLPEAPPAGATTQAPAPTEVPPANGGGAA